MKLRSQIERRLNPDLSVIAPIEDDPMRRIDPLWSCFEQTFQTRLDINQTNQWRFN